MDTKIPTNSYLEITVGLLLLDGDDVEYKRLDANTSHRKALKKFLNGEWVSRKMEYYVFDEIRSWTSPYYTSEMFFFKVETIDIQSEISTESNFLNLVFRGTLKQYSREEVLRKYQKEDALNKTWSNSHPVGITIRQFSELIDNAFHILTRNEGISIPGIGDICMMKSKIEILE